MAVGHGLVQAADVYPRSQSRAPGLRGAPWLPSEGISPRRGRTQGQVAGQVMNPRGRRWAGSLGAWLCWPLCHQGHAIHGATLHGVTPQATPHRHPSQGRCLLTTASPRHFPCAHALAAVPRSICRMAPLPSSLIVGETQALEGQGGSHSQVAAGLVGACLCVQTSLGGSGRGCWGRIPSNYSGLPTVRAGPAPRWWLTAGEET